MYSCVDDEEKRRVMKEIGVSRFQEKRFIGDQHEFLPAEQS